MLIAVVVATAAIVAGTIVVVNSQTRAAAERGYRATETAQALLIAMLDRETGLRGYLLTGDRAFLEPYVTGGENFQRAVREAKSFTKEPREAKIALGFQVAIAQRWQRKAAAAIADVGRAGVKANDLSAALERKGVMDQFRAVNSSYLEAVNAQRKAELSRVTLIGTLVVVGVALIQALSGALLVRLTARGERQRHEALAALEHDREAREQRYVASLRQFGELIQASETETEARELIRRRIEIGLPGASLVVLNRNNSANRLEAVTPCEDTDTEAALVDASPRSCLAVRLGRTQADINQPDSLISCEVCGRGAGHTLCEPLPVGGEVIGSLLIKAPDELDGEARRMITDTVAYASPVLANLRNLAIAERRAHTDALTGLPNRRALDETFKRLLAQAVRASAPLSAVLMDLDHFKQVNDTHGHDRGDEVLAAVAAALSDSLREMDFAGRLGGEEFLLLLPETDADGARVASEGIARAIAKAFVSGVDVSVTASFGVAAYPEHGVDPASLLRSADRALYQAKQDGRNCIRVAQAAPDGAVEVDPDASRLVALSRPARARAPR